MEVSVGIRAGASGGLATRVSHRGIADSNGATPSVGVVPLNSCNTMTGMVTDEHSYGGPSDEDWRQSIARKVNDYIMDLDSVFVANHLAPNDPSQWAGRVTKFPRHNAARACQVI